MTLNFERPSLQEQVMKENEGLRRYSEFLLARDGEADLLRQRLSKREGFFDNITRNPIRSCAPIDRATYFRNMAHGRRETGWPSCRPMKSFSLGRAMPATRSGTPPFSLRAKSSKPAARSVMPI